MKALIVLGGEPPERALAERYFSWADRVLCTDSGANALAAWRLWPDLLVGDMDSVSYTHLDVYKRQVIDGLRETGVTTMLTRRGVDAGPILMQEKMAILPEETAGELSARMAGVGARLLCKTLAALEKGELIPVEQDPEQATQCPMLAKEHGRIPWSDPAEAIANRVRGVNPWPGAYCYYEAVSYTHLWVLPCLPGTDRQPSTQLWLPSLATMTGFTIFSGPSPQSITTTRRKIPTCGAARPTPGAAYMVSSISSKSVSRRSSNFVTGRHTFRSVGSPSVNIVRRAILPLPPGSISCS